jgi:hypothetical protein
MEGIMTLQELQIKLGEQVELITDQKTPYSAKKQIAEIAMTVSSLAKQMINNADVADGKLKQSSIIKMINNGQETN